ncbi:putative velvet family sexual development regulator [Psilocybe cubensis]|uniref:Velvet domain-containing protein n=2 Tax=Psilocybe cubensis TaxID=181762 RepID=A0A8H7XQV4_PSICU|nr:putative velvet family sexual development regulator [Psilocybe cubensis]KAH9474682.1 putative velvet family sexual development regulator [Psilocybe cubensis]
MYSQYQLNTQPLASSSQPQAAPSTSYTSTRQHNSGLPSPLLSPPSGRAVLHPERGTALIGRPIYFQSGPYVGRTIRTELHEIQKADLGRKYARVDRRPLDPPPVVLLKMFEVHNAGTDREQEEEMEYDDVQVLGLLCTVDLFPVPGPDSLAEHTSPRHSGKTSSAPATHSRFVSSSPSPSSPSGSPYGQQSQQTHGYTHSPTPGASSSYSRFSKGLPSHFSGYMMPSDASTDIVHYVDGYPITENSKQTQALVGATFVQPVVMDYQGSKAIIFVFADLAVKIEGYFILRYRAFDIFARPYSNTNDLAISSECYGGMFRVYSTKEFPGLSASTELTKRLSLWGVRLNIRVSERRRRKRPASDGRRSPTPEPRALRSGDDD